MARNIKPKLSAGAAYENAHLIARDQIDRIHELLTEMPAPEDGPTIHWGHVGTVVEINSRLASIIEMLSCC